MSTERERARNRAKQKRFMARHPGYSKERTRKKAANRLPKVTKIGLYRTFELCDPLDPEEKPRIVGYCKTNITPVWKLLWKVRHYSKSYWAQWLCHVEDLGLLPKERVSRWDVGLSMGVSRHIVKFATRIRIRRINYLTTGNPKKAPNWLLRNYATFCGQAGFSIGCISDREVLRFNNLRDASAKFNLSAECLRKAAFEINTIQGYTWFDD